MKCGTSRGERPSITVGIMGEMIQHACCAPAASLIRRCTGGTLCLALLGITPGTLAAQSPSPQPMRVGASAQAQFTPPECTHKTRLDDTPLNRAWVFVMNFRVGNTGCLIVYDRTQPNLVVRYKPLPDVCQAHGDVRFSDGRGYFRDGYVACNVHIMNAVNEVAPPAAQITETAVITAFYVLGRGIISPTLTITPDQESIIMAYKPDNPNLPTVSLGVVVTSTNPAQAKLVARFNANRYALDECGFALDPDSNYSVAYTRPGDGIKMWLVSNAGREELCSYEPLPLVKLHQDGGTFYIGGVPEGLRFEGVLEEAIFDPYDGTGPNSVRVGEEIESSFVFLPLTLK